MATFAYPPGALLKRTNDSAGGPVRLIRATSPSRGRVRFLWTGAEHEMNLGDATLRRLELFSGVPVSWQCADSTVLGEVLELSGLSEDGLRRYRVRSSDGEHLKEESDLNPLPVDKSDPLSMLRANAWDAPKDFSRRKSFLRLLEAWFRQTTGIPSLMGVRIEPMGHQIYAMRRVLAASKPRFILADEVGLGKTIEAGLVLQALMQEAPNLRVLVIAPGSMSRQWLSEMYLRFGAQAFGLLEAEKLSALGKQAHEYARSRLERGRVIVSSTALLASTRLRQWVTEAPWDVVVLDEAHRIAAGHTLYQTVLDLAKRSVGFLALSATPSSKELAGLSSLLSLVSPDVYQPGSTMALEERIASQKSVWRALRDTISYLDAAAREGADLDAQDFLFLATLWEKAGIDDPAISELTANVRNGSSEAIEELVAYVQEYHRIDQRLIRTRRTTLTAQGKQWPIRRLEVLEYEPSHAEMNLLNHLAELPVPGDPESETAGLRLLYERMCCVCPKHAISCLEFRKKHLDAGVSSEGNDAFERLLQDPEPGYELMLQSVVLRSAPELTGERAWLLTALHLLNEWRQSERDVPSRFRAAADWIKNHLSRGIQQKVLVFCQEADVVARFAVFLRTRLAASVETFHYQRAEEELSQVAQQFQNRPELRVLVSDELGGEGRNFQIATAVLHLDSPWSVSRVEQRIGRLDRIARPADRDVLSVVTVGPGEMERATFEILRDVFRVYEQSIGGLEFGLPAIQRRLTDAMRTGAIGLRSAHDDLRALVSSEIERADDAFESALDSSKRQLSEGIALARSLTEAQAVGGGRDILLSWAARLGLKVTNQPGGCIEIVSDPDNYRGARERLPYAGRTLISGTFDYGVAMRNDSLQFLGPGHPLIDFLIREFESDGEGRAAAAKVAVGPRNVDRIILLMMVKCAPNLDVLGKRSLSPALRLRIMELFPPCRVRVEAELLPYDSPPSRRIEEHDREFVSALWNASQPEAVDPLELNRIAPLMQIWQAAEQAVADALVRVRQAHTAKRSAALEQLNNTLRFERKYLAWRVSRGDTHAAKELALLERAAGAIEEEVVSLDSVLVVAGVGTR